MSDQSKLGIGKLITRDQHRDAIHVAIAPVVADHSMPPGSHVGVSKTGCANQTLPHVGIIDPFLNKDVAKGDKCWLFLYPGTITSLRHEWIHPAFDGEVICDKAKSVKWLEEYVKRVCPYYEDYGGDGYSQFIERAQRGEIYYYGTDLHGVYDLEEPDELFEHLSIVLGREVGAQHFTYSCSC